MRKPKVTASPELNVSELEDESLYEVLLKRPILIGRAVVRGPVATLKGKVIKENADDCASIQPVAA